MKLNRILRLIRYQKTRICTVRLRAVSFSNHYKTIFEMAKGDISVEIKKREELLDAERHFQNHHARLDVFDENLSILSWKQPGTQAYGVRAVFDEMHVYITGDLGSAVVHLTEKADLKTLSSYWKSPSYFVEKIRCSTDKYEFSYEEAKAELLEKVSSLKERFLERQEKCGNTDDEAIAEYAEELNDVKEKLLEGFNDSCGLCGDPSAITEWSALDPDYFEWLPHSGRKIHKRIWLWLAAFEMAYKEIKAD